MRAVRNRRAPLRWTFSRGRWAVERERCAIESPAPPSAFTDARALGCVLAEALPELRLDADSPVAEMEGQWEALVGKAVASHSRPGSLSGGCLTVYVDSSVWLAELGRGNAAALLRAVCARPGPNSVRSVRLRLDPERAGGIAR
jgi:predicted nucleic acid-binding Zn ribbon protein